ncbi:MAG TPA: PLDc N-terminal domain-containing protein, partial [Polyangiaceae bacterium]|nr:PLDc N-terminal domain-containing protein [Polyangiaceae bacterium]
MHGHLESYLLAHVTTVIAAIAAFVMVSGFSGPRRTSQSTLAWLLGIVFVPFVTIPLFLAFGSRKFPGTAKGPEDDADRRARIGEEGTKKPTIA